MQIGRERQFRFLGFGHLGIRSNEFFREFFAINSRRSFECFQNMTNRIGYRGFIDRFHPNGRDEKHSFAMPENLQAPTAETAGQLLHHIGGRADLR